MRTIVPSILVALSLVASQAYAADTVQEMFSEGTLNGAIRYYYYHLDNKGAKDAGDSVAGGFLAYKTAPLKGISLGATLATANDVATDKDWASYAMLQTSGDDNHKSFSKISEYYVQGEWLNTTLKYGGQEIYTPLMNMDYCRILPNTYSGLTVVNRSVKDLELHGYYITGFSGWTDSTFKDIVKSVDSSAHGKPLMVGGARYSVPVGTTNLGLEGWVYHMDDVVDTQYARANLSKNIGDYNIYFMPSLMMQKSNGDNLGGKFDTYEYGFETGVDAYGVKLKGFYSKTGDDKQFTPWGFGKIVMQQFLVSGWQANEEAYGALIGYDLGKVGVPGLSTYVWYNRYDAPYTGANTRGGASEIDYNVQYEFKKSLNYAAVDGLKLEVGYAMINNDHTDNQNELRLRLSFPFSLGNGAKQ